MPDATNSPAKKKKGRLAFAATDDQRARVRALAAARQHHDAIAAEIGCSVPTLRKHFADDLANRLADENLFTSPDGETDLQPQPAPPSRRPPRTAGGRPKRQPTSFERVHVAELAAVGQSVADIAIVLKASEPWVRKAFATELAVGAVQKRAELTQLVWRAAKKGSVPAMRMMTEMLDRADLAKAHDNIAGKDAAASEKKAQPLGKKDAAQLEAQAVLLDSDWSDVLAQKPRAPLN